jgi:hypothetical protein
VEPSTAQGDFAFDARGMTGSQHYAEGTWRYEGVDGPGHWMRLEGGRGSSAAPRLERSFIGLPDAQVSPVKARRQRLSPARRRG